MQPIENLSEQVFVTTLLAKVNEKVSSLLDSFSGWMIGGFGASATLLVSQYESVSKHLDAKSIQQFLTLFLWSLGAGVIAKYLAVGVAAHSQSSSTGREMGEKASTDSNQLDFNIIFKEMERTILPPMRWFAKRGFEKARSGDLVSGTRKMTIVLQAQGVLTLAQAVIVMIAIYRIGRAFHA